MGFICGLCNSTFKTANYLKKHLNNTIPCHLVCKDCGTRFDNRMQYSRHIVHGCEPVEYTTQQIENIKEQLNQKKVKVSNINGVKGNNNNTVNTNFNNCNNNNNNTTTNTNNYFVIHVGDINTSYIKKNGIHPHEYIGIFDLTIFHSLIYERVSQFVDLHIQDNNTEYTKEELKTLLLDIAKLIHSNKNYPQYMNIMDDNAKSSKNKIYSGTQFIEDAISKTHRNRRILMNILSLIGGCKEQLQRDPSFQIYVEFIDKHLIPILHESFITDNISDELQESWQYNKNVIDQLDIESLPKCDENEPDVLTADKICSQLKEFIGQQEMMYREYSIILNNRIANEGNLFYSKFKNKLQ